jgi:cytosine/adenosine deaminase-related metal-dependent hydrolase
VADVIAIDLDRIQYSGAGDPVAAIIFCGPVEVDLSIINGRVVVDDGQFVDFDLRSVLRRHHKLAAQMRG